MSFTIKDLQNLTNSQEFAEYKDKYQRFIILWEKIYARRKDLWFTQSKLWELSWISQNKISELESWTYGEPWIEMISKLSKALNIWFEYLSYDSITRKTVELYNYILSKLDNVPDIMQFMKLPYFIDLELIKNNFKQATNFEYIRWNYWPFDKKVYVYQTLFSFDNEKWIKNLIYIYLSEDERKIIDETLVKLPKNNWEELKKLSYETPPMKKLWVCYKDNKCMGRVLDLN